MGDGLHHHEQAKMTTVRQHYHPAVEGVVSIVCNANRDLSLIQINIEHEFQAIYSDQASSCLFCFSLFIPCCWVSFRVQYWSFVARIMKDLIDRVRVSLCTQKSSLNKLLKSSGLPLKNDSGDFGIYKSNSDN